MKKSKILLFVLAFVLVISMMSACGNKEGGNAVVSTSTADTQPAQEELQPVELIYYTNGNSQPAETGLVEAEMNKILTEKINATIKLNFIAWGDYPSKMNVLAAAGNSFDICFSAGWRDYTPMAAKGAYADLTNLLPKYAAEYLAEMTSLTVGAMVIDAAKIGGKQFAAPNLQGLANSLKLFVNSEIFDKYKMPSSIKTMDDLDIYCDAIVKGEPGMIPLYGYTASGQFQPFTSYLFAANPSIYAIGDQKMPGAYSDDLKVFNQYETDRAKDWYKWVRKAYQKGWISKSAATSKDDVNILKSKKAALVFAGSCPQYDSSNWESYKPIIFKAIDIGNVPTVLTSTCISTMYSVNANSKNIERSVMFINLINTDKKLYNTLCYGVEGKNYVLKDGFVDLPEGITADNNGYNPGSNWAFGFTYNGYPKKGESLKVGEEQLAYDKAAKPETALGFSFDAEPVKAEIANIQSVLEEYAPALTTGVVDPDTGLATLIAKMKAAGSDKVIVEKQKQLDAWRAANGK